MFMSFRWRTMGNRDDDDDDDEEMILGYSDDLNETLQNLIDQIEYVIELFQTIESANPESEEYKEAQKFIMPAIRGLGLTFQEMVSAIHATESIDERTKKRLFALIDEILEYFDQIRNGELSLHGLIEKLQELRNTVENLAVSTESQISLLENLNRIIELLESFKTVGNGSGLLLGMQYFENKYKPIIRLIADEWSQLDVFTELSYLQFQNPRNKQRFYSIMDSIIAKLKEYASKQQN